MASKPLPSPEDIRQLMSYDPETGKLFWKERGAEWFTANRRHTADIQAGSWNKKYAGKEAFTPINSAGYHTGTVLGKMLMAHRIAWAIVHGRWPEHFLDHINRVRTDNRLANLREATNAENLRNRSVARNNESGTKGVRMDKRSKRWQARIKIGGTSISLGAFASRDEAAAAYTAAAKKYHGEFAWRG